MKELTTIFEITSGSNGIRADALFRVAIGVVVLIAGIAGLLSRKQTQGQISKKPYVFKFMVGWAVLWLFFHVPLWRTGTTHINHLLEVYRNGKSQIAEGLVHVSYVQPATGHAGGDKISVGDQKFEVNYFLATPGYKQTISHGGGLREGIFARLHHYEGVILKVEIETKAAEHDKLT
jgi:hypothetical protein